ncbi:MAG: DNA mismatch repair protein MutS, partial [Arenibacter sp.]|nr:DNA mismatch repair protein MutS [Arenibacter sp.]
MAKISSKTLQDLEFHTVLQQLSVRCTTELGKEQVLDITPIRAKEELLATLGQTSEYLSSFTNDNRIPGHDFDAISQELKLLRIENTTIEISGFKRIAGICNSVATHTKFLKKF